MRAKIYAGYKSFDYLEPDIDFRNFPLVSDTERVPRYEYPLSGQQRERVDRLLDENPIVSLHEHTGVRPLDPKQIFDARREIRDPMGYAGLALSGLDAVFENFMDGTGTVTSKAGWKWDDIVLDIGMRFSDIQHQDFVFRAETVSDVLCAKSTGRLALVPSLESATPIENELDRVDVLYGLGIRCMGLTYSESNHLGSGLKEKRDGGLTDFGRSVVRRMNKLGMTIDLSHCGDQTSLDAIAASERPVFITHAGARAIWPTRRMKPDEVILACAERGGVIGVEAAPHTTLTRELRVHTIESVMAHVAYCVSLVGADHVAIGPDTMFGDHVASHRLFANLLAIAATHASGMEFPQIDYVVGMENPGEALLNATRWLVAHDYSDADIANIVGGNAIRVLKQTWWK